MAYEKLLNEIYAAVSLKYLWQDYKPSFVKSESPDWINETMELGLEVSQALLPDDGQTESFIEQYLGWKKEELPASALERYGNRLHFYNGRFWAILPEENKQQDYLFKAKYRFEQKLEKLNTNYKHRRYNGLYLFLHPMEEDSIDAEQLFVYMQNRQKNVNVRFDWVFLNCVKVIYVCNYIKNVIEPIILPPNAENFLNTEAEALRYCGEWSDGVSLDDVIANSRRGQVFP
ncbi:MAG: hypothetical protein Q4C61_14935 [Lachnospiraceae bacterium]|nr:hypothetical protein [Lachnospiraceae bacterium]